MPDYSKGKIYKIVNSVNDKIYIGSTTLALPDRMKAHRYRAKADRSKFYKAMRWHGIKNFSIVLIKSVSCSELENVEYEITNKMKSAGVKLYNVRFDGKNAASHIQRMTGINHPLYGKLGKDSCSFKRGCVGYSQQRRSPYWGFKWRENGKPRKKTFSVSKYGYDKAKRLAEEYRNKIYPID